MKAFLSHSSKDKQLVRSVANKLGRQSCIFDEQAFSNGEEFKTSISRFLEDTSMFVLFASRNSLQSVWVNFEIEEAWFQKLRKNLNKSVVYLIDSSVDASRIPEWLGKARISRYNSAQLIARDIRHHLSELLQERQRPFFVNRTEEIREAEQALSPPDGSTPPRVVLIHGLPGIGRRALIRRIAPDFLNLHKSVEIYAEDGDSIHDICVKIADKVEPYSTKERFNILFDKIMRLPEEKALERIVTNLEIMIENSEIPVFVDEGGLVDAEGFVQDSFRRILQRIEYGENIYAFLVSNRRPKNILDFFLPMVRVRQLDPNSTKTLLLRLLSRETLQLDSSNLSQLADYVAGYPPSASLAVEQVKCYGIEVVLRDKGTFVRARSGVFIKYISDINLDEFEKDILRILMVYAPLPF